MLLAFLESFDHTRNQAYMKRILIIHDELLMNQVEAPRKLNHAICHHHGSLSIQTLI